MSLSLNHLLKAQLQIQSPLGLGLHPYGFGEDIVQSISRPHELWSLTIGSQHLFVGNGACSHDEAGLPLQL